MMHIIVLAAALFLATPTFAEAPLPTLTVTGEGRSDAAPDMATVRLGVLAEAPGAREAIDTMSRSMAGVLERLQGLGIAERDVQTSEFSVNPRWTRTSDGTPPEIAAFVARNMVTVRVRDLDGLGGVLDAVTRDGANLFSGLSFGLSDPQSAEDAARAAAVADARRKAALYAEAAGVELGALQSLSEAGGSAPPMPMMRAEMAMASDAVPVAAGEVAVRARVTLTYAIAE